METETLSSSDPPSHNEYSKKENQKTPRIIIPRKLKPNESATYFSRLEWTIFLDAEIIKSPTPTLNTYREQTVFAATEIDMEWVP